MTPEQAEAAKKTFASESRNFAEKEGYDLGWSRYEKKWYVITPRKLRPGEKFQFFDSQEIAWEVAAIRAGRKIVRNAAPPHTMRADRPLKPRIHHK
jgi:hypothetical protein